MKRLFNICISIFWFAILFPMLVAGYSIVLNDEHPPSYILRIIACLAALIAFAIFRKREKSQKIKGAKGVFAGLFDASVFVFFIFSIVLGAFYVFVAAQR